MKELEDVYMSYVPRIALINGYLKPTEDPFKKPYISLRKDLKDLQFKPSRWSAPTRSLDEE